MRLFSTSGDAGDAVYSLCIVKAMGGGKIAFTHRARTRENLLHDRRWQNLQRLFEAQDYIDEVFADGNVKADVDLDLFRSAFFPAMQRDYPRARWVAIPTWMAFVHGVDPKCQDEKWLTVEPNPVAKYVINRSPRYHGAGFPWKEIVDKIGKESVFIGTLDEHRDFINSFGMVSYLETPDLMDVAQVIAGSQWFIGNQSCPNAIAEGMKHSLLQESWPQNANCLFNRTNAVFALNRQTAIDWLDKQ